MPSSSWSDLLKKADAEGGGFSIIPDGDYDLVISKSEARKSQNGKDMFVIQAKVIDGPNKGRLVFNNFVISPESPISLRIFFQQMKILGLTDETLFASNPSSEQIASAIHGKVFRGTVKTEKDNKGEDRNVIKNFATPTEAARVGAVAVLAESGNSSAPSTSATPTAGGGVPPSPSGVPTPQAPAAAPPPAAPAAPAAPVPPPPAPTAPEPASAPVQTDSVIPPPPPQPNF